MYFICYLYLLRIFYELLGVSKGEKLVFPFIYDERNNTDCSWQVSGIGIGNIFVISDFLGSFNLQAVGELVQVSMWKIVFGDDKVLEVGA